MAREKSTSHGDRKAGAEVDAFMARLSHPLKAEVELLRALIRKARRDLDEGIKWNAPSYSLDGQDRLTMNLSAKDRIRLVFHRGATKRDSRDTGRLIKDPSGLLEWASDDRAIATFRSADDIKAHQAAVTDLVKRWLTATG